MKKVINLTLYNIGQAKGFILVVALLQILLQLGLKVKTLATARSFTVCSCFQDHVLESTGLNY